MDLGVRGRCPAVQQQQRAPRQHHFQQASLPQAQATRRSASSCPTPSSSSSACSATALRHGSSSSSSSSSRLPSPTAPLPPRGRDGEQQDEPSTSGSRGGASSHHPHDRDTTTLWLERLYSHGAWGPDSPLAPGVLLLKLDDRPQRTRNQERGPDYFANVGDAIRCLREDIPLLFTQELNYSIYRDDVTFRDPRNCFQGMKNYQLIFWSLRFHGKIFFKTLYVDVKRIWQPEDNVIKMRWTVHGIPRVPWEAEGTFDGISTYRLDGDGKIYEHSVDNILLRDPPMATNPPMLAGLNLVPSQQPAPGIFCKGSEEDARWAWCLQRLSWVRLYSSLVFTMQLLELEPALAVAALF